MLKNDITFLGHIVRVDSGSVEIEIDETISSSNRIVNGKLYRIGQIGSLIKIPMGNIVIYAIISSVSNVPNIEDGESLLVNDKGSKFLTANLIGEKIGSNPFERGIGTYPTVNDEVHLVIEDDLVDIYGHIEKEGIKIGTHSASDNLDIYCNLNKLLLRHCAIFGSTGSGKSNTTVSLIKNIINNYDSSRIVLIDPHGEYSSAFPNAKIFKIGDDKNPLFVPFWLMNFEELSYFLLGVDPGKENALKIRKFRELVTNEKKKNSIDIDDSINENSVTADSPIPFNLRKMWYEMNWEVNATYNISDISEQIKENAEVLEKGNPDELIPASFKPFGQGSNPPFKSKKEDFYDYEKKIFHKLKDSRFDYLFNPGKHTFNENFKDLDNLLDEWINNNERITILDLSGIPFEVLDVTVGLITRFIYDSMFWGRNLEFTGKNRPLLMIFEEAHTYLNKNNFSAYSKKSVEKIFKEGRKFGVGALIISQRPSEISETILSQIGTFISLKLTNSADQSIVKSLAPDNLNNLIELLPSLKIGESIIVGESIKLPSRVKIKLNTPRPRSEDPDVSKSWGKDHDKTVDYGHVINNMREQKFGR